MRPPVKIVVQTIRDVTVATIAEASIVETHQVESVKDTLFPLIDQQHRTRLILDMSKVKYLSSSAIGVLVPLRDKYNKAKGTLILVGVTPEIKKLFSITGLAKLFKFADTEAQALSSLGVTIP